MFVKVHVSAYSTVAHSTVPVYYSIHYLAPKLWNIPSHKDLSNVYVQENDIFNDKVYVMFSWLKQASVHVKTQTDLYISCLGKNSHCLLFNDFMWHLCNHDTAIKQKNRRTVLHTQACNRNRMINTPMFPNICGYNWDGRREGLQLKSPELLFWAYGDHSNTVKIDHCALPVPISYSFRHLGFLSLGHFSRLHPHVVQDPFLKVTFFLHTITVSFNFTL